MLNQLWTIPRTEIIKLVPYTSKERVKTVNRLKYQNHFKQYHSLTDFHYQRLYFALSKSRRSSGAWIAQRTFGLSADRSETCGTFATLCDSHQATP